MHKRFEFATATRIIFGPGTLRDVGPVAAAMGSRALLVTGRSAERAGPLLDVLAAEGIGMTVFSVGLMSSNLAFKPFIASASSWKSSRVSKLCL